MSALLGLAALPAGTTPFPVATPDAALLRLGERFEAAWAAETAAWDAAGGHDDDHPLSIRANKLAASTAAIVGEIEHAPATTLPGLLVKGRAARWCCVNEPPTRDLFDYNPLLPRRELTTNERVILSLLTDLHALTGVAA